MLNNMKIADEVVIPQMKFHHVSLNVDNYDESCAFYQALGFKTYCEWTFEDDGPGYKMGWRNCFLHSFGHPVLEIHECNQASIHTGVQEHFCFILESDCDVEDIYNLAIDHGAKVLAEPFSITLNCSPKAIKDARVCHVEGPSGEHIEFICWHGYEPEAKEGFTEFH